jgi:hypothetical protein
MAVAQVTQVETLTVIRETAADAITIRRAPVKDPATGKVHIVFSVEIKYSTYEYHGTSPTDINDIVKQTNYGKFELSQTRIQQLFSKLLTLEGGTQLTLGDLLANEADSDIAGDIRDLTVMRIMPGITREVTADGVAFRTYKLDGCTYVWSTSDPNAYVEVSADNIVTVHGGARPLVLTCEATETASGIKASSSVTVN